MEGMEVDKCEIDQGEVAEADKDYAEGLLLTEDRKSVSSRHSAYY